ATVSRPARPAALRRSVGGGQDGGGVEGRARRVRLPAGVAPWARAARPRERRPLVVHSRRRAATTRRPCLRRCAGRGARARRHGRRRLGWGAGAGVRDARCAPRPSGPRPHVRPGRGPPRFRTRTGCCTSTTPLPTCSRSTDGSPVLWTGRTPGPAHPTLAWLGLRQFCTLLRWALSASAPPGPERGLLPTSSTDSLRVMPHSPAGIHIPPCRPPGGW